ncbi:kinase-like domain-containing protein [Phycomyces nitens]|nr:kinase-like domain-containing protein [Phycomyces nitens]
MSKAPLMKRIITLFKKTHEKDEEPVYPAELERVYKVTRKTLGVGSFAVVKECIHRTTHQSFALKIILKKAIADILKQVRHPHIVSMHGLYESKDAIVHRDMKPENAKQLLFQTTDENASLMITDFGLSKILKNHDDVLTTACGTPGYVAPEVLLQTGYGKPVDLWSVGVITFTLLSGYTPFWGDDQASLFESIIAGKYEFDEEYWSDISEPAKDLINKLLTFEPSKRITADDALCHPWITNDQVAGPRPSTNLVPNVRRGISSQKSLKSVVTAMTLLSVWKHGLHEATHRRASGEKHNKRENAVQTLDVTKSEVHSTLAAHS